MPANTSPIFTLTPTSTWGKVTGVDGSTDGTDADIVLVTTAGTNGAYIEKLICHPISTSGSTSTSAAAIRIYINNGSTVGTGTNNLLIKQQSVPIIPVNVAATTAPNNDVEIPIMFQLQAGYKLYVGITAMAANTQWNILSVAGDY